MRAGVRHVLYACRLQLSKWANKKRNLHLTGPHPAALATAKPDLMPRAIFFDSEIEYTNFSREFNTRPVADERRLRIPNEQCQKVTFALTCAFCWNCFVFAINILMISYFKTTFRNAKFSQICMWWVNICFNTNVNKVYISLMCIFFRNIRSDCGMPYEKNIIPENLCDK